MTHNNQSNQLFADEVKETPIPSFENKKLNQTSSSRNIQPKKRKAPSKKAAPPAFLNQPTFGQVYQHTQQSAPVWNIPQISQQLSQSHLHPFIQTPHMAATYPYVNPYTPWVPCPPSSRLHPYYQHREMAPSIHDFLSTVHCRNQNSVEFSAVPEMVPQSQFENSGSTESEQLEQIPQCNSNNSFMYPQASTKMNSNVNHHQYERQAMSAFQFYKRPSTGAISELQSQDNSNQISTHFDLNQPVHSTHSINEDNNDLLNKESAVNDVNGRIENKKVLDPLSAIDETYDLSCVICQENKKDTVLMPCRHLCVCDKCCETIELCPLCRKIVIETITVFT